MSDKTIYEFIRDMGFSFYIDTTTHIEGPLKGLPTLYSSVPITDVEVERLNYFLELNPDYELAVYKEDVHVGAPDNMVEIYFKKIRDASLTMLKLL